MARAGPSVASLLSQLDLGSYATKLGDLGYKFSSCVATPRAHPPRTATCTAYDDGDRRDLTSENPNELERLLDGMMRPPEARRLLSELRHLTPPATPLASPIEMVQSVSRKLRLTDSPDAHSTAAGGEHSRYNQLFRFLSSIGLNKFASVLIENEVDFETLLIFTEADLKELGIAKGPRVKMLRTMHDWHKRDTAPDPGSETSSPRPGRKVLQLEAASPAPEDEFFDLPEPVRPTCANPCRC